jgi:uncharacterized protein (TIGR03067 family)
MPRLSAGALLLVLVCTSLALAQSTATSSPLQGRWVVTAAEHQGKPFDAIKGGVMTIAGDAFEVRTASGNVLKGTLQLDVSKQPWQMDLLHADGGRWQAIYAVEGDSFRLNYVDMDGKEPRPTTFTTSDTTEATVINLRRESK